MIKTNYKFSREHRLLCAKDYSRVFDRATKVNNKAFTLLARTNNTTIARLGLIIAKKNIKQACQRNAVKRLLREGFRLDQEGFSGFDIIILTRRDIAQLSKKDIIQMRENLFDRFTNKCKPS